MIVQMKLLAQILNLVIKKYLNGIQSDSNKHDLLFVLQEVSPYRYAQTNFIKKSLWNKVTGKNGSRSPWPWNLEKHSSEHNFRQVIRPSSILVPTFTNGFWTKAKAVKSLKINVRRMHSTVGCEHCSTYNHFWWSKNVRLMHSTVASEHRST